VDQNLLAVVRGVTAAEGLIDYPLFEESDRLADPLAAPDQEAQSAVTGYRRLAETELPFAVGRHPTSRYSLVEARPRTGRRHQLDRIHRRRILQRRARHGHQAVDGHTLRRRLELGQLCQ
jgi:tRNA pseudouridine65 synthase